MVSPRASGSAILVAEAVMVRRAVLAALLLSGCYTGSANTIAGAAVTTGLALGASAASRASGGCYAMCTNGTVCNERTGLCEVLPCRGQCSSNEHCEQTFSETKCVPGPATGVTAEAQGKEVKTPAVAPIVNAPDQTGPPQIVPAAEQQPPQKQ
jgi:hypothetical protein